MIQDYKQKISNLRIYSWIMMIIGAIACVIGSVATWQTHSLIVCGIWLAGTFVPLYIGLFFHIAAGDVEAKNEPYSKEQLLLKFNRINYGDLKHLDREVLESAWKTLFPETNTKVE